MNTFGEIRAGGIPEDEGALEVRRLALDQPGVSHRQVLESQLPRKIADLFFTITYRNIKLTFLWGSWLSEND